VNLQEAPGTCTKQASWDVAYWRGKGP